MIIYIILSLSILYVYILFRPLAVCILGTLTTQCLMLMVSTKALEHGFVSPEADLHPLAKQYGYWLLFYTFIMLISRILLHSYFVMYEFLWCCNQGK